MTEQISALADNEIALEDAEHLLAAMQPNSHASEVWGQYHLIGDVMRGANPLSVDFKQNLMAKIDLEPTVLSPNAAMLNDVINETKHNQLEISNAKTKLPVTWSIAASFAAVMAVGWVVLQTQVTIPGQAVMVAEVAPTAVTSSQELTALTAASDQTIPEEYLMAHQASAPTATSYYIQSASYSE